ncbi:putative tetratricopeptide-like helical domain superfamily [Helianthus annuus]|nr:putative tetratricopeptide-like helical domain superfamily [Helianthus annuus]
MDERGCKTDIYAYSTIIDSLCKDKMIDDAFNLFEEMVFHKGILPDVITYTSLIHDLCNLGRWGEVSKMLKEMEEEMASPNFQTFSILVDTFCKEGKVDEVEAVVKFMVERCEVPDVVTYNSLINGYCLRGDMSKAKTLLDSLTYVFTYNSLLSFFADIMLFWKKKFITNAMFKKISQMVLFND